MNNHLSLNEVVSRLWNVEKAEGLKITLLGIGPMSGYIITAIFELARDENFPVIFTASRNQVDTEALGGGYVLGWDQGKFRKEIDGYAEKAGFKGLLFLCRDHGGPWHRDNEKREMLPEKEAMERAKASYLADILAGFDLLHIDPTVDPHIKGYVPLETVIRRTIELIAYIEEERERRGIKRISYEVGTEETAGGTTDFKAFEQFLIDLISGAEKSGLPKPDFIVGQTGTLLRMRTNVGSFNPEKSKELAGIARRYGAGFKEHNADFLDSKVLSAHPSLGITASNIGPEFSIAETDAYLKLAGIEEKAIRNKKSAEASDFIAVIQNATIKSGRWKKWLPKNKSHFTEIEIAQDREMLNEIVSVCGRYVNDEVEVREARKKLFNNLRKTGVVRDPRREIIESIRKSIKRCTDAFNLKGVTSKIMK